VSLASKKRNIERERTLVLQTLQRTLINRDCIVVGAENGYKWEKKLKRIVSVKKTKKMMVQMKNKLVVKIALVVLIFQRWN